MKKITQLYIVILTTVLFSTSCQQDDVLPDDTDQQNQAILTKTELKPYELALLEFNTNLESQESYSGTIESQDIEFKPNGNYLIFQVPKGSLGSKSGSVTINDNDVYFEYQLIANSFSDPESYLQNYFTEQQSQDNELRELQNKFIEDSIPGFEDIQADLAIWDQIANDAQAEFAAFSSEDKEKLAQLIDANSEWLQRLDDALLLESLYSINNKSSKEDCRALIEQGRIESASGETFTAAGTAIQAYWCALTFDERQYEEVENDVERGLLLMEDVEISPGSGFLNTLTNMVVRKIDALTKEVQGLMSSNGIADEIFEIDQKKVSEIPFRDGEPEAIFAKIRYRCINQDDINTSGTAGQAATFFNQIIDSYNKIIEASEQPLIWRPGFTTTSVVRDFNRFLSIPSESVSNDDIVLINTQYRDDNWEAAFGNDGNEQEPSFNFQLNYDDGHIQLQKTISAKIVEEECEPCNGLTSFTDPRDGKTYDLVEIDCQCWFKENLKYQTADSWWYDNSSANGNIYGRLYTWNAALNACPSGWHLPSDAEWKALTDFLGGEDVAGGKMKSTIYWDAPNVGATNSSGFSGLPGGVYASGSNGDFFYWIGENASWWSSTVEDTSYAKMQGLSNNNDDSYRYKALKEVGLSCRCLKD